LLPPHYNCTVYTSPEQSSRLLASWLKSFDLIALLDLVTIASSRNFHHPSILLLAYYHSPYIPAHHPSLKRPFLVIFVER